MAVRCYAFTAQRALIQLLLVRAPLLCKCSNAIDAPGLSRNPSHVTVRSLTPRQSEILCAVVTEYTKSGEPVSSRRLSECYELELSTASIRNAMAELEAAGYLRQPYTSAGRVPTEAAFRVFIDALMRVEQLPKQDASKIASWYSRLPEGADLVRATGSLLAEMSGTAAWLLLPRVETRRLTKVRFVNTRPGEVLTVLILADGSLENRLVQLDEAFDDSTLERLHNLLEDVVAGKTLKELLSHFKSAVRKQRSELRKVYGIGVSLLTAAIRKADRNADILIEGQSALLERVQRQDDKEAMRTVLRALEDRQLLIELFEGITKDERSTRVLLGGQTLPKVGYPLSLVAAPFGDEGRSAGALGVMGRTPMDYPAVVPLVRAVAQAMSAALGTQPKH